MSRRRRLVEKKLGRLTEAEWSIFRRKVEILLATTPELRSLNCCCGGLTVAEVAVIEEVKAGETSLSSRQRPQFSNGAALRRFEELEAELDKPARFPFFEASPRERRRDPRERSVTKTNGLKTRVERHRREAHRVRMQAF